MVGNSPFGVGGPESLTADLPGSVDLPSNEIGEAILAMDEEAITLSEWLGRYGKNTPEPVRTLRTLIHHGGYFYTLGVTENNNGIIVKMPAQCLNDW